MKPWPRGLTRRSFAGILASLVAPGCRAPAGRRTGLIDAHTHFYDPRRSGGVPWPPKDDALLHRPVLPDELKALASPRGVTGTIVVEASPREEDNAWVLELAAREPFILGVVGHLKPGLPGFADLLARFAANPKFRGIRTGLWNVKVDPADAVFMRDLGLVAEAGLALDVGAGHELLAAVPALAARLPELTIVVNHLGGPHIDGKAVDEAWRAAIRALAPHRNVFLKLSGLVEATGRTDGSAPRDLAFYRPWLDVLWEALGEDRLIFASNWPVSARFASYEAVLGLVTEDLLARPASARAKVLAGNARRAYRV